MDQPNPAAVCEPDGAWAARAARHLADVRRALAGLPGADAAAYDHVDTEAAR